MARGALLLCPCPVLYELLIGLPFPNYSGEPSENEAHPCLVAVVHYFPFGLAEPGIVVEVVVSSDEPKRVA